MAGNGREGWDPVEWQSGYAQTADFIYRKTR